MKRIGTLLLLVVLWACGNSDEEESSVKSSKRLSTMSVVIDDILMDKRTFTYDEKGRLSKYVSNEGFCAIAYDKNKVTLVSRDWTCVCDLNNAGLATKMLITYNDTDSEFEQVEITCLYENKNLKSLEYVEYPNTVIFPDDKVRESAINFQYTNKALSKLLEKDGDEQYVRTFESKDIVNTHNLLFGLLHENEESPEIITYYTGVLGIISPYLLGSESSNDHSDVFTYKLDDNNIVLECNNGTKMFKYTYEDLK